MEGQHRHLQLVAHSSEDIAERPLRHLHITPCNMLGQAASGPLSENNFHPLKSGVAPANQTKERAKTENS